MRNDAIIGWLQNYELRHNAMLTSGLSDEQEEIEREKFHNEYADFCQQQGLPEIEPSWLIQLINKFRNNG